MACSRLAPTRFVPLLVLLDLLKGVPRPFAQLFLAHAKHVAAKP